MLPLVLMTAAALARPDAAAMVRAANQRIAVAAGVRCPPPAPGEIVVCGRASARDRYLLPLPSLPEAGSPHAVNALAERERLLLPGRWDEPSPVGGHGGYLLSTIQSAFAEGEFTPLHRRFEGPDIVIAPIPKN